MPLSRAKPVVTAVMSNRFFWCLTLRLKSCPAADKIIVAGSIILGLCFRLLTYGHATSDTAKYLLPWYEAAAAGKFHALGAGITNYTPFYSYLLLAVVQFDGVLPPLLLIKSISYLFEIGSALLAYRVVAIARGGLWPALAFSALFLAPSVLFNGPLWGQVDSIWSFFIIAAVYLCCVSRLRWATVAFSVGVAVKAQAVFLGPFLFGFVIRRRLHWLWLTAIPLVYGILALPAIIAGRPAIDVLRIYLAQAETFHDLARNAANLWLFVPPQFYWPGLFVGLEIVFAAGLAFSIGFARIDVRSPTIIVLAAAASLQLMPFLLPKMHERYFYGFEILSIVLAFLDPRYAIVAIIAQVDAILAYLPFEMQHGISVLGAPLAAVLNTILLVSVQCALWQRTVLNRRALALSVCIAAALYVSWCGILTVAVPTQDLLRWWPADRADLVGFSAYLAIFGALCFGAFTYNRVKAAATVIATN